MSKVAVDMSEVTEPTEPSSDMGVISDAPSVAPDGAVGPITDVATVSNARRPDGKFAHGNKVSQTHGRRARKGLTRPEDSALYGEWQR